MKHMHWFTLGMLIMLVLAVAPPTASRTVAASPVVIDFEDLPAGGRFDRTQVAVVDQYADRGITFNHPAAFDYSKGSGAIPDFAHSGTKAMEQCVGIEFCVAPIEMSFSQAQPRVKVWIGFADEAGLREQRMVLLIALDANGLEVGRDTAVLNVGPSPQPIRTSLEVSLGTASVTRAQVRFAGGHATNGLAIDDVEFDIAGPPIPPPPCTGTAAPSVTLTRPTNDLIVRQNAFRLQGVITTDSPLTSVILTVTGAGGTSMLDLTASIPADGVFNKDIIDQLFPGANIITLSTTNCVGTGQSGSLTVRLEQPIVDLLISSVDPIQVVQNADLFHDGSIDLVRDKPAVVRVRIQINNGSELDPDQPITTRLSFQNRHMLETRTVGELRNPNFFVDFFLAPSLDGDATIEAHVDAGNRIPEVNENNNSGTALVTVKDTHGLYVAYVRVDCLGQLANYATTVTQAGAFLLGQFPVAPAEFTNHGLDASLNRNLCVNGRPGLPPAQPSPPLPPGTCPPPRGGIPDYCIPAGADFDWIMLWSLGKHLTNGQADIVVGIVDSNWTNVRMPRSGGVPANGYTYCGANRTFVRDGRWDTVSHEVGHIYQLNHPNAKTCKDRSVDLTNTGFWVEQTRAVQGAGPLMGPGGPMPPPFPQPNRWITRDQYESVFANYFRTSKFDPEVLLVSGILHKDGGVQWAPFYRLPNGIIDEADSGAFTIEVLDVDGNILYERPFDAQFFLQLDSATGSETVETDTVPFGFAVPYVAEAAVVQIQRNDKVLAHTFVATQLLRDAVLSIPDSGFDRRPPERRRALLNKIDALDARLSAGDLQGARNKLQNDIRRHLVEWLVDDYPTQSPLEYTKPAILDLVDKLIQRLAQAAFPSTGIRDGFNRQNGPLVNNWYGEARLTGYQVVNKQLDISSGGPIYWKAGAFGPTIEAYATFLRVDPDDGEQALLLKVQGEGNNPDYRQGAIKVVYDANARVVRVETIEPGQNSWTVRSSFAATLHDGDQLGARALADGQVAVFLNGQQVGAADAGSFFVNKRGRIGLWFRDASDAVLDDFGGGTPSR